MEFKFLSSSVLFLVVLGELFWGDFKNLCYFVLFVYWGFSFQFLLLPDRIYLLHKQHGKRLPCTEIMWPLYNVNPTISIYTLAQLYCSPLVTFNRFHFCSSSYLTKGYSAFSESASVPPYPINLQPLILIRQAVLHNLLLFVAKYRTGIPLWKFQLPLESSKGPVIYKFKRESISEKKKKVT